LFACLLKTDVIYAHDEGKDSEAIAALLKGRLKDGDRVIAEAPYDVPLEYYFDKQMVPTGFLFSDPKVSPQLFVISPIIQTPESVLGEFSDPVGAGLGSPVLIRRFTDTSLFVVERTEP
jgi:hypothetical protein